jgi:hypothetical protein
LINRLKLIGLFVQYAKEGSVFQRVLCVYPYRKDLKKFRFIPPIGLEFIGKIIEPYTQALDIIDLRYESNRTADFLRPETDMVCFSVNWKRHVEFLREEIMSVPPDIFTVLGGRHATEDPAGWLNSCPNVDAVVRGDGEEVMEEICQGVPLEKIARVKLSQGKQHFPQSRPQIGGNEGSALSQPKPSPIHL